MLSVVKLIGAVEDDATNPDKAIKSVGALDKDDTETVSSADSCGVASCRLVFGGEYLLFL